MDVARGEIVEAELDRFIRTRHDRRVADEGERSALEAWAESERRYDGRRRQENRAAWYGWHLDQAERHRRTLEALIASHEERAAEPVDGWPEGERSPQSEQTGERGGGEKPSRPLFGKQPHASGQNRTVLQSPIPPNVKTVFPSPIPRFLKKN
jgi:hypothetical protein